MADVHPQAAQVKLSETCGCGAAFTVEDDDVVMCNASMADWRQQHKCVDPRYRSPESSTGTRLDFGFTRYVRRPLDAA